MKKIFITLTLFCLALPAISQINKTGIPFVKYYSIKDYNASGQNWAVCQDKRGVMYFGNEQGVLEFDGFTWKKITNANNSGIRSMAIDSSGIIYAGGVNEFGYLRPDMHGDMIYISLRQDLDSLDSKPEVWKTYTRDDEVFFCTANRIYHFKDKKLKNIYKDSGKWAFLSFQVNGEIYWGSYDSGLLKLENDTVVLAKGGEFYKDMDIRVMLPYEDNRIFIAATGYGGYYFYDTETGLTQRLTDVNPEFSNIIEVFEEKYLYNGIQLSDGTYALATLEGGLYNVDINGNIIHHLAKNSGLQDITVLGVFESSNGGVWLALNNGISYVEINSPFHKLGPEQGLESITMDITRFNGKLYIATQLGLFYLSFENGLPYFEKIEGINNMIWSLTKIEINNQEKLIAATQGGAFDIKDPYNVDDIIVSLEDQYDVRHIHQSKKNENIIYLAQRAGVNKYEYKNGKWSDMQNITIKGVTHIFEDEHFNLWLLTGLNGIYKLQNDTLVKHYDGSSGLPSLNINRKAISIIQDEIIVGTQDGLYVYNPESDEFEKYQGFGSEFGERTDKVDLVRSENENTFWVFSVKEAAERSEDQDYYYIERISFEGEYSVDILDLPFKRLRDYEFHSIYTEPDVVWLGTSEGIISFDPNDRVNYSSFYNGMVRKVNVGIDSVVFWGTNYTDTINYKVSLEQPDQLKRIIKYSDNRVEFYCATPYFPTDHMQFSFILEGYEREWSSWGNKIDPEYTNLDLGKYTFKVKARNIYGFESEIAEYSFSILPPWYKTIWAYIGYAIIAIAIVVVIVKIYTRRLELEKIRLEQIVKERTEEVVQQKEEIAEKNKNITDSIEYASRIQKAILPSNEFAEEILPEHFILFRPRDIVSGDFYWLNKKDNLIVAIAADCTGHGVPGAFMSMLGVSFLNEIVNRHEVTTANVILNELRKDVKKTLDQQGKEGEAKDGMDLALTIIDLENKKLQYAGAYNPLYLYRNGELIEVKADRMPIGIYVKEKESFTNNEIDIQKGDTFYIFSDGFPDQFGGENGHKFKSKNFKKLLQDIQSKSMAEQHKFLDAEFDSWRGEIEQIDDVIILGIRI